MMNMEEFTGDEVAEPAASYDTRDGKPYFIDPLGDFGFKRLFGAEQNKALTITFLNHALKGKREIVSIEFLKNEYPGETLDEGGAVIDMVCRDQNGRFFVVEMQKNWQQNFKDRSLFYASRLITEQAPHGNRKQWAYAIKDVYVIALLEQFTIGAENKAQWHHYGTIVNPDTGQIINERLCFIYIELLNFTRTEDQLQSELENWLYALKNLKHLKQAPAAFTEPNLLQFCEAARYINLTTEEKHMISTKTKNRWDYYNVIDGAKLQGEARGKARGKVEGAHENAVKIAVKMLIEKEPIEKIAKYTGLRIEEIKEL